MVTGNVCNICTTGTRLELIIYRKDRVRQKGTESVTGRYKGQKQERNTVGSNLTNIWK